MHFSIIQQIQVTYHISDIRQVSDEMKLAIYREAIREIKEGMENRNPNDIPQQSLIQYEDALNEISIAFSYLGNTIIGERYKIKTQVLRRVNKSLTCISRIKAIIQKNQGKNYKTTEYFAKLIEMRTIVIEIYEHLRDE